MDISKKGQASAKTDVFYFPESRGSMSKSPSKPESKEAGAKKKGSVMQFPSRMEGQQKEPKSPMPPQHQRRPGIEAKMNPRPRYEAPLYKGSEKLKHKVALITGGDSGIGRAVAVLYAREGANIAIVYLPVEQEDAEETRQVVENEGRACLLIPGDVTDSAFCRRAVAQTARTFGRFDILVNNAAFQKRQEGLEELSDEQFEKTFRTNIFGYFYMAKAAVQHMKPGSAIINTGSETGLEGNKKLLDYGTTKGAIHAFSKSLAQSLVEKGIRVNCVAPGPVWTPLNVADKSAMDLAKHGQDTPLGRPAQPEEIAPAYVFFASEACSSYITGEVLSIMGGETTAA